ncbi:eCIS core domain-containing protein [Tenacibaculum xiamenense]|uniref:eCIS core domain-containing protein n=1 Tax=Tenacibaculum xiamenense TaxID=1261553 RepID=UPI0038B5D49F
MKYQDKERRNKSNPAQRAEAKGKAIKDNREHNTIQRKPNNTGLPDNLKSGIENLSGHSMDDVKVHYNSNKPAQLNAHAYAQGTNIHLGAGQEKHLAHEAWHVVQQKQGRVQPTTSVNGSSVNDSTSLENEADVMGSKASSFQLKKDESKTFKNNSIKTGAIQLKKDQGFYKANDGGKVRSVDDKSKVLGTYQKGGRLKITDGVNTKDSKFKTGGMFSSEREHVKGFAFTKDKITHVGWINEEKIGAPLPNDVGKKNEVNDNNKIKLEEIYTRAVSYLKNKNAKDDLLSETNAKYKYNKTLYGMLGTGDAPGYTASRDYSVSNNVPKGFDPQGGVGGQKYGAYFHVDNKKKQDPTKTQRRMIFNVKSQSSAHFVASALREDMKTNNVIVSFKFYGSDDKSETTLKYDKVVVYYQAEKSKIGDAKEFVESTVKGMLNDHASKKDKKAGVKRSENEKKEAYKSLLADKVSPFYNQIDKGIGDGVEIAGTSFTIDRTKNLMEFITKHKDDLESGKMSKEEFVKEAEKFVKEKVDAEESK